MKKRMFLTTILMTLVLLVAVTTATFAWYVAGTNDASYTGADQSITTRDDQVSLGSVKFTATIEFVNESKATAAAADLDLVNTAGEAKYYVGQSNELVDTPNAIKHGFIKVTVTASKDGDGDLAKLLADFWATDADGKVVLTVSVDDAKETGLQVKAVDGSGATLSHNAYAANVDGLTANITQSDINATTPYVVYLAYWVLEDGTHQTALVGGQISAELA